MRNVVFHPLAEQEVIDAAVYYEEQSQGLGLEYVAEVERAANLLINRTYAKAVGIRPLAPKFGGTESIKAPRIGGLGANA